MILLACYIASFTCSELLFDALFFAVVYPWSCLLVTSLHWLFSTLRRSCILSSILPVDLLAYYLHCFFVCLALFIHSLTLYSAPSVVVLVSYIASLTIQHSQPLTFIFPVLYQWSCLPTTLILYLFSTLSHSLILYSTPFVAVPASYIASLTTYLSSRFLVVRFSDTRDDCNVCLTLS